MDEGRITLKDAVYNECWTHNINANHQRFDPLTLVTENSIERPKI